MKPGDFGFALATFEDEPGVVHTTELPNILLELLPKSKAKSKAKGKAKVKSKPKKASSDSEDSKGVDAWDAEAHSDPEKADRDKSVMLYTL
eukprot:3125078-Karenia_brevis.AAC.1